MVLGVTVALAPALLARHDLKQYTAEAQANQAKLADVVAKIEAADLATQRAAALAAAQAKKNNN